MSHSKVILFRHVLVWVLFISYELAVIKVTVGIISSPFQFVIYYALNIALFYTNAHVILDFAFFKTSRPYLIAILLIVAELGIFLFIKLHVDAWLSGKNTVTFTLDTIHERLYLTNIFREIFFVGFSIAYWSLLYMVRFKQRNHVMEKENLKQVAHSLEMENKYITAENAYLQNQISPHLLFNTLNFIYNTIHHLSAKAGRGVMLLGELMHYSLLSSQDNRKVSLLEEVKQIEKLIELSGMRFDNELHIRFVKKGRLKEVSIPPLILVTLVENMLKHGDVGEKSHPGRINLEVNENQLIFKTQNLKRKSSPHPPGGIGLFNIQKRLSNLYPKNHWFNTSEDENIYHTELILNL
jgi:two-component system LytT family sensor kinase